MSERILNYWHHLKVLEKAETSKLFDSILYYSDRELVLCIKEIFINLGNLNLEISDKDLSFLKRNIDGVSALTQLGGTKTSLEDDRGLILSHSLLVKKGLGIALQSLRNSFNYGEEDSDLLSD